MSAAHSEVDCEIPLLRLDSLNLRKRPIVRAYLAAPLTDLSPARQQFTERCRETIKDSLEGARSHAYEVYDPSVYTAPGSNHSPEEVYSIDRAEVLKSDLLVVCHTNASNGVGQEVQIANDAGIPIVICHHKSVRISRVMSGSPSLAIPVLDFSRVKELKRILGENDRAIGTAVCAAMVRRRQARESGTQRAVRAMIIKRRLLMGLSREQLSLRLGVPCEYLRQIEQSDDVLGNLAQWRIELIFLVLSSRSSLVPGKGTVICDVDSESELKQIPENLQPTARASLDELIAFVLTDDPKDDQRVLGMWKDFREMCCTGLAGQRPLDVIRMPEDWRRLYHQRPLF